MQIVKYEPLNKTIETCVDSKKKNLDIPLKTDINRLYCLTHNPIS